MIMRPRIAHEEVVDHGHGHVIAEKGAADKEDAAEDNEGRDVFLLLLIETRRDEHPDFVEDDGRGEKKGGDEGYLEIGDERLGDAREYEGAFGGHHLDERAA